MIDGSSVSIAWLTCWIIFISIALSIRRLHLGGLAVSYVCRDISFEWRNQSDRNPDVMKQSTNQQATFLCHEEINQSNGYKTCHYSEQSIECCRPFTNT